MQASSSLDELIYGTLETVRALADLDLAAYLHERPGEGPRLFLAAPSMSEIDAGHAFELFSSLRDAMEHTHADDETVLLGRYLAMLIGTSARDGRGLHVYGRLQRDIETHERAVLGRLARAMVPAIDALDAPAAAKARVAEVELDHISIELTADGAKARVHINTPHGVRVGDGEAHTPNRAAAAAVVDALERSSKVLDVADGDVGSSHASMVVVVDADGRTEIGAALIVDSDHVRSVARAAIHAVQRLRATPPAD